MPRLLALLWLAPLALTAGCASQTPAARLPLRALSSEAPRLRLGEPEREAPAQRDARQPHIASPRIGAPGGSGAGSRRVLPAQSGNDTVGGLPVGIGGGSGPAGRG